MTMAEYYIYQEQSMKVSQSKQDTDEENEQIELDTEEE
jgi:hypothetical protein